MYDGDDEQTEAAAAAELESSSDIDDQSSIDAVMLKALQPADGDTMQPGMWHVCLSQFVRKPFDY